MLPEKLAMSLDLKLTLNLPKTAFPMKANLVQTEPKRLARWREMDIYQQIRDLRKGAPTYILHDGPPYANGPIHLGHALNKCLKDFVVKSKTMAGFDSPYVPGWDCHGLPIEIKVDEALGRKKLEMPPSAVRRACRKYAEKYVDLQREQFKRIGIFGRFDHPYSTMTPQYESTTASIFFKFLENGFIYKGLRPVYWCMRDQTALAEAEVEYEMDTSPSIWVKYPLVSDPAIIDQSLAAMHVNTIIWTTTPWTLPASLAIAFHPQVEYVALDHHGQCYIVAKPLARSTIEKCGLQGAREVVRFPGSRMEHALFKHPFLEREILGVVAEYVTTDQGTGAVHTAPSHGVDDFYTGSRYKLDQTCNVDDAGRYREGLSEYAGKQVFEANPAIIELLQQRKMLMASEKIEHSYPHCWRCHQPVIFRATEQWFISMETPMSGGSLRLRALEEIKKVTWDPSWGEERISNMIATRPDWCISRQRIWGVPIATFFCEACGNLLKSQKVNQAVVDLFAREGADSWYLKDAAAILPPDTNCDDCGGNDFRKESDILDVWFESGSSQAAVLKEQDGLSWPADLYLEGGDQYRGWFHSSLLCAVGDRDQAPYRTVATNGWTLDPQGRAMSKSLNNGVDPVETANRLGGEVVRLWAASVDFRDDVRCSDELMLRVADNYRKIRNTFRYILSNLYDFSVDDALSYDQMDPLDRFMLDRTAEHAAQIRKWYGELAFHKIYHLLHDYCAVDLSALYFDVIKDRLYTSAAHSRKRRSAQTAIWKIGEILVRLAAPIMSFTADEVWEHLPQVAGRFSSVHLETFHSATEGATAETGNSVLSGEWKKVFSTLLALREDVLKPLEEARQAKVIGSNIEAKVRIILSQDIYSTLRGHEEELRNLLKISQVSLEPGADSLASPATVEVAYADGSKCERCWNYSVHVGENLDHPTICERCTEALQEIAEYSSR